MEKLEFSIDDNDGKLLDNLLQKHDGVLYFDVVLDNLTMEEALKLYQYLKYHYYYYFHIIERDIIETYQRHGIKLQPVFIEYPTVKECTYSGSRKLKLLFEEFRFAYSDTDEKTINYFISEFRKKAKFDISRTYADIMRLINIKRERPNFKLVVDNITSYNLGSSFGKAEQDLDIETLKITRYEEADFTHELSHILYRLCDRDNGDTLEFNDICDLIPTKAGIAAISSYLSDFKRRYMSTRNHFLELYYKEIEKRFGSFSNYCEHLKQDILDSKTDVIVFEDNYGNITSFKVTPDTIKECVGQILEDEGNNYLDLCIHNYYIEERSLVTILDAVLRGAIGEGELSDFRPACHDRQYFYGNQHGPFMESLAAYEVIKYSPKANVLIDKLEDLIGGALVEILENHLCTRRLAEPKGFAYQKVGKDN